MKKSVKDLWIILGLDALYLIGVLILCIVNDDPGGFLYFPWYILTVVITFYTCGIPLGLSACLWWVFNSETCGRWVKINAILGACSVVLNMLLILPFVVLPMPETLQVIVEFACLLVIPALIVSWIVMGIVGAVRKRRNKKAE